MAHVDALSRCVAHIEELPLERRLEHLQLTDSKILEISKNLELEESDRFALCDGLVYRKVDKELKFVIPESMVASMLRAHHDELAHCGAEKTLQSISQNFWFPTMRKRVYEYVSNCLTCIMSNASTNRYERETQLYTLPTMPFDILHVDHFGPLQETAEKYKHILVIVDAFSRFTWLFPTRSTGTKESLKYIENVITTFGKPAEIVMDRGTAFTSREFIEFMEKEGIKHQKIAVAAPWANGMVERVNRFIKTSLTKLIDSPENWKSHLSVMQYVINNTYHSATKASPAKLMFGFDQRSHSGNSLARFTQDLANIDTELETARNSSRDTATQATKVLREYNKAYRDASSKKPTIYKEGDYVLIRNDRGKIGVSSKLKPNYKGPYLITKSLGSNRYVVKDIPGFNVTQKPLNTILSSDRIKPWVKIPEK